MKVWGRDRPRPEGDLRRYYELAIDGIAESGIAVEVSTAGLRKRAQEIYPAPAFLEMCLEAGAPVALSSDAHRPEDVGADYEQALELLAEAGVEELCVFERRERRLEPHRRPDQAQAQPSDEPCGHRLRLAPTGAGSPADPGRRGDP